MIKEGAISIWTKSLPNKMVFWKSISFWNKESKSKDNQTSLYKVFNSQLE